MLPVAGTVGRAASSPARSCISYPSVPRPASGRCSAPPTDVTPGSAASRSINFAWNAAWPAYDVMPLGPHGSETWKVIAFAGSNPMRAFRRFQKLRPRSPAATRSVSAIATCSATSPFCARRHPRLDLARVARSRSNSPSVPVRVSAMSPTMPPMSAAQATTSAMLPAVNETS